MQNPQTTSFKLLLFCCTVMLCYTCNNVTDAHHLSDHQLPHIEKDLLKLNQIEGIVYFNETPFNGYSVKFYEKDVLSAKRKYINGKRNGKDQKWYPDGLLSFEADYVDGKLHGKSISWWKNGNKRSESNYINGVSEGIQQQWYLSGAKFKKMILVNGKESGIQQSWRENGKLYNNYEAKDGRIFGLRRSKLCFTISDEEVQLTSNNKAQTPVPSPQN